MRWHLSRITISICFLFGMALTTLIAWFVHPRHMPAPPHGPGVCWIGEQGTMDSGASGFFYNVYAFRSFPEGQDPPRSVTYLYPHEAAPAWVRARQYKDSVIYTMGWPMRCLWYGEGTLGIESTRHGEIRIPEQWPVLGGNNLPAHIRWLPFALNSVVLTIPFVLTAWGFSVRQRNVRYERGQCMYCGYDRSELARSSRCPKCRKKNR